MAEIIATNRREMEARRRSRSYLRKNFSRKAASVEGAKLSGEFYFELFNYGMLIKEGNSRTTTDFIM